MNEKTQLLEIELGPDTARLTLFECQGKVSEVEIGLGYAQLLYDRAGRAIAIGDGAAAMIADLGLPISLGGLTPRSVRERAAGALAREALRCAGIIDEPMRRPEHIRAAPLCPGARPDARVRLVGLGPAERATDIARAFEVEFATRGLSAATAR